MSDFQFMFDLILSGIEDVSVFSPVILVRLIVFMLILELVGSSIGIIAKAVSSAGGGR